MSYLVDVNVWLAISTPGHVHHRTALDWFESSDEKAFFCRVTQMGFLRLITNPRVMDISVLSTEKAWHVLGALLEDSRIGIATEPAGLDEEWRGQTRGHSMGHNFWTDAYLAAFASASDLTVVTFDRAFARRKDVSVQVLR
jgi:toxin-antitoxin system PIN domain toxin